MKINIKIKSVLLFLILSLWITASSSAADSDVAGIQSKNRGVVLDKIATKLVEKMPDDIHLRLVGIAAIEGDDGTLVDMITAKIKSATNLHLIERQDLDKLLQEQGIQLSPYTDSRTPIEPGKIKGVEGLLLGKIVKNQCSFLTCNIDVFLKLNDVEGGEVVFADNFAASHTPQTTILGLGAILAFIIIIWLSAKIKGTGKAMKVRAISKDNAALLELQNELKKVRDNINKVHDDLVSADKMDQSVSVRNVKEDISSLLANIEQAPGIQLDNLNLTSGRDAKSNRKSLASTIKTIVKESERLVKASKSNDMNLLGSVLEIVKKETRDASNCLHEKKTGQA